MGISTLFGSDAAGCIEKMQRERLDTIDCSTRNFARACLFQYICVVSILLFSKGVPFIQTLQAIVTTYVAVHVGNLVHGNIHLS